MEPTVLRVRHCNSDWHARGLLDQRDLPTSEVPAQAARRAALLAQLGHVSALLAHALGLAPGNDHRLRVSPSSLSTLPCAGDREPSRPLAACGTGSLAHVSG